MLLYKIANKSQGLDVSPLNSPPVLTSANLTGPDEVDSLAALGWTGQRLIFSGHEPKDE